MAWRALWLGSSKRLHVKHVFTCSPRSRVLDPSLLTLDSQKTWVSLPWPRRACLDWLDVESFSDPSILPKMAIFSWKSRKKRVIVRLFLVTFSAWKVRQFSRKNGHFLTFFKEKWRSWVSHFLRPNFFAGLSVRKLAEDRKKSWYPVYPIRLLTILP